MTVEKRHHTNRYSATHAHRLGVVLQAMVRFPEKSGNAFLISDNPLRSAILLFPKSTAKI